MKKSSTLTFFKITLILLLFTWVSSCSSDTQEITNTQNGGPIDDANYEITTQKNESVWWINDWFSINQ